jgi:hypothetical protein
LSTDDLRLEFVISNGIAGTAAVALSETAAHHKVWPMMCGSGLATL